MVKYTNSRQSRPQTYRLGVTAAILGSVGLLGGTLALHELGFSRQADTAQAAEPAASPDGFANIVAKVRPAVLSVRVIIDETRETASTNAGKSPAVSPDSVSSGEQGVILGEGSGFFISADGYAVTNNHVVDHAEAVVVATGDGKSYKAKVVGTDSKTDLALIKVDGHDFPYVRFADRQPRVGDWVIAIGNPYGLGGTVTSGIVSAEGRDINANPYDNFIQIDAPINRGNSGGPAFDVDGNVIGVNTAIFTPSEGSVGIGFDIPAATVKAVVAQLKDKGYVTRGWLGIHDEPIVADIAAALGLSKARGVLVDDVEPTGPAIDAGLKPGDAITAVNGAPIDDPLDLAQKIGQMAPGTTVSLSIHRNGEAKDLNMKLGTMPVDRQPQVTAPTESRVGTPKKQDLGLVLAPANQTAGTSKPGVMVVAVDPNGQAAEHGLQAGDIILEVGGKTVSNPNDVHTSLASLRNSGKAAALLRIKSGDAIRFVALPLTNA
ncbi:trypsin-like peptidase domain-containing protein [Mesorhizobium argentiipisi]|uniref:Probable periplasmic serine endoprotease DegP-like n=1 Tax=Mesorhizobium argentiipisi TaxID=3015175 RepID=A0ABU8K7U4_9HYPH